MTAAVEAKSATGCDTAATASVHAIGASSSSEAELCQFCREVVRLHVVVLGRRTQDTWVAEVLAAHASGVTADKSAEEKSDDGGFGAVAEATLEVLDKLEGLFEAVGGMEDGETARGVAQLVAEGVTAASMEAFISTRVEAAAAGRKTDTSAQQPRAETWLTQAFRERESVKSGSRSRGKMKISKKANRSSSSHSSKKSSDPIIAGAKKPKKTSS